MPQPSTAGHSGISALLFEHGFCASCNVRRYGRGAQRTRRCLPGKSSGRPFLWFVSFGRAKEMNPQCGCGNPHQNKSHRSSDTKSKSGFRPAPE